MPHEVMGAPSSEAFKPNLAQPLDGIVAEAVQTSEGKWHGDVGTGDFLRSFKTMIF